MQNGARVLVTGGTGTIGSSLVKHLLEFQKPKLVRVLSRDLEKQDDLMRELKDPRLDLVVGSVASQSAVALAMIDIDYVFHCAAFKHVSRAEVEPLEAIQTNVSGTQNLLLSSVLFPPIRKIILVSTDKACDPKGIMGITKYLMERVMVAVVNRLRINAVCVRFGNVIPSRGSVFEIWKRQIQAGQDVTITDPAMTRFFMSRSDAVATMLYAARWGRPGEIIVPRLPSMSISQLALAVMSYYGTARVEHVGKKDGERTHEHLISEEEAQRTTTQGSFYAIHTSGVPNPIDGAVFSARKDLLLDNDAAVTMVAQALRESEE